MNSVGIPHNSQRLAWLDIARGIGIILVVAGHVERGLVSSNIAKSDVWSVLDLGIYTFHMPLFMLLAGLNVTTSLKKGKSSFLVSKIRSVILPYLIWSIIQGSLLIIFAGSTNNSMGLVDLFSIGWKPISPFWFLYALFVYFCIVTVTIDRYILILMGLCSIILADSFDPGSFVNLLCHHFLFFVIGATAGDWIKAWSPSRPTLILLAGMAGYFIGWQILAPDKTAYSSVTALPCAIMGMVVVLAIARMLDRSAPYLEWIGQRSMPIYVMHIIAASGSRIVLQKFGLTAEAPVYFLVGLASGVAFPLIAFTIMTKFGVTPIFGLGDRPKPVGRAQEHTASPRSPLP